MKFLQARKDFLLPLFLGGFAIFCSTIIVAFHKKVLDKLLKNYMTLHPTSEMAKEWENPSGEVTVELYFFNWTNPDDFKNISVKPKFKEIGPYFFFQEFHRTNVTYNDNSTVSYRNKKTFYFNEERSNGTLNDNITTLNIVPTIAVDKAKNWNFFLRKGLSISLSSLSYHITKKTREFIFDGFEDPLLDKAKYLPFLDGIPNMDKFAWFYNRNDSADFEGVFNIGTGAGNTSLGTLYNWNYKAKGPYPGNCSKLQAPLGELFEPHITKNKLEFFAFEFCRVITLDFNETMDWNGIEAYRFVGDASFFGNEENSGKSCMCPRKCSKFGVADYSSCKFGVPAYISFPHFFKADPFFSEEVDGMKPDERKHEMYMIINPETGVVLEISMAVQLNILVEPNPAVRKYRNVPEVMFPIIWFTVKTTIPLHVRTKLKLFLMMPVVIEIFSVLLFLFGMILVVRSFKKQLKNKRHKKTKKHIYEFIKDKSVNDEAVVKI